MILRLYPPTPVSVEVPPISYIDNGTPTNVSDENGLPSLAMVYKNGVQTPISDDDDPNEVVAMPVKIMGVDGTNINITAGDINIQSTSEGASFDSIRLGDGSGVYLKIEADGSINAIVDQSVTEGKLDSIKAVLDLINGKDFATETKLEAVRLLIASLDGKDFATETTLSAVSTKLDSLATSAGQSGIVTAIQNIVFDKTGLATSAKQDTELLKLTEMDLELENQTVELGEIKTAIGTGNTKLTEIDNAVDAMSVKLPASLGAKTGASSLSIVPATDAGMATSALQTAGNNTLSIILSGISELVAQAGAALMEVSTSTVNTSTPTTFTPPSGAKRMAIINNAGTNADSIRWVAGAQTPTANFGALLVPSAQSPLYPAGEIKVIARESNADVSVAWFG